MSETVSYIENNDGTYTRRQEIRSKVTEGMKERRKLKPFGDPEGRYSTEIMPEVKFKFVSHEPVVCLDDYGPNEEQLLAEIRKENEKEMRKLKKKIYNRVKEDVKYDKKTVIVSNIDDMVSEHDIYEICSEYGDVCSVYKNMYSNIAFVGFYDEEGGIRCEGELCKIKYNNILLETEFMKL